ncbi:3D domain-containing protein [Metabacillus sp. HB246100]
MRAFKRSVATLSILLLSLPISYVANAQTSNDTLNSANQQLEQNQQTILQKEKEQETIFKEINTIQQTIATFDADISQNEQNLTQIENKINEIQQLIEQKKEEIIFLQDKVYAREGIMEKRLVALQHNDHTSILIETLVNSESVGNFFERIGAVATLLNADKEILDEQEADLKKIEEEKQEINRQELLLFSQQTDLEAKKAKLEEARQKRNFALKEMEQQYTTIAAEISSAEKETAKIQSEITAIQDQIAKEEAAAKARAIELAKAEKEKQEALVQQAVSKPSVQAKPSTTDSTASSSTSSSSPTTRKEFYVTATAYSHEDTKNDVTYLGYNIKKNKNMKLIAVDPGVIPLGSKVWVEGYGEAIAGDTGGAIIGHKIDVLMPSSAKALQWGRKNVKVIILD